MKNAAVALVLVVLAGPGAALALAASHALDGKLKSRPGEKLALKVKTDSAGAATKITKLGIKKWTSGCNDEIRDTTSKGKTVTAALGSFKLKAKRGGIYSVTEKVKRVAGVKFEVSVVVTAKNAAKANGHITFGYLGGEDLVCAGGGDFTAKVK